MMPWATRYGKQAPVLDADIVGRPDLLTLAARV